MKKGTGKTTGSKTTGGGKKKMMSSSNIKKNLMSGLAAGGGIVGGSLLMHQLTKDRGGEPSKIPAPVPGLVGIVAGCFLAVQPNPVIASAGVGLIGAGAIDLTKKLTTGKTGVLAKVNEAIPALSGVEEDYEHGSYGSSEAQMIDSNLRGLPPVSEMKARAIDAAL